MVYLFYSFSACYGIIVSDFIIFFIIYSLFIINIASYFYVLFIFYLELLFISCFYLVYSQIDHVTGLVIRISVLLG